MIIPILKVQSIKGAEHDRDGQQGCKDNSLHHCFSAQKGSPLFCDAAAPLPDDTCLRLQAGPCRNYSGLLS